MTTNNATPFFLVLHKHSTLKVLICLVANSISPPNPHPLRWGGLLSNFDALPQSRNLVDLRLELKKQDVIRELL